MTEEEYLQMRIDLAKAEARRRRREKLAGEARMRSSCATQGDLWADLAPVLDAAVILGEGNDRLIEHGRQVGPKVALGGAA